MDETFNALYKIEIIKRQGPWRDAEHLGPGTMTYIHWINHKRLHSEIGEIPPAEFEANLYVHLRVETNNPTPTATKFKRAATSHFRHRNLTRSCAPQSSRCAIHGQPRFNQAHTFGAASEPQSHQARPRSL